MRHYLKKLRMEKNLTQAELALSLGITQNYYSNIENGNRMKRMDLQLLKKIADYYEVSIDWLVDEEIKVMEKGA